jgi:hypothetical protein
MPSMMMAVSPKNAVEKLDILGVESVDVIVDKGLDRQAGEDCFRLRLSIGRRMLRVVIGGTELGDFVARQPPNQSRGGGALKLQPRPPSPVCLSPLRRRIGREAIQAATSDSIQAVRPPMSRPRGNVLARIQLQTVT